MADEPRWTLNRDGLAARPIPANDAAIIFDLRTEVLTLKQCLAQVHLEKFELERRIEAYLEQWRGGYR